MRTLSDLPESGCVTPRWAMKRYDISRGTLYRWVAEGRLPPLYRIGPRAVRFRIEDLREFEARFKTNCAATR